MILITPETLEAFLIVREQGTSVKAFQNAMSRRDDPNWKRLFDFYNQFNKPVGRGCFPCYGKVYQFTFKVLKESGYLETEKPKEVRALDFDAWKYLRPLYEEFILRGYSIEDIKKLTLISYDWFEQEKTSAV